MLLDRADTMQYICRMSMCAIQYNNVYLCLYQCSGTLQHISRDTDRCAAEQTSLCILGRIRVLDLLFDIFNCNKTFQIEIVIYDRELLFSRLGKNFFCLLNRCADLCRDQSL